MANAKTFAARKRQFDGGKKLLGRALPQLNWHKNNGKGVVVVSLGIDEPLPWRARHIHHHTSVTPKKRGLPAGTGFQFNA
jgi:hypothetical protein